MIMEWSSRGWATRSEPDLDEDLYICLAERQIEIDYWMEGLNERA